MMYKRKLNLRQLLENKSHFLFGPRQTGKSTLIESDLADAFLVDLLDNAEFHAYLKSPRLLGERLEAEGKAKIVVIDEIQKLPSLLDEVQRLMKAQKWVFLLTGSSARKLKKPGINLLGGRAWSGSLFPLIYKEIHRFDLHRYLLRGGLPSIYDSKNYKKDLKAYTQDYLRQEIIGEALVRRIEPFARMLDVVGRSNGGELNYASIASDSGVSDVTIKTYIEILEDTLIGYKLPAFTQSVKRKGSSRHKFYFFDVGVANALKGEFPLEPRTALFGECFEHFIIGEIRAYLSYTDDSRAMRYWRSQNGAFEVDLILEKDLAMEIKSSDSIGDRHLKGLRAFAEEKICQRHLVISQEKQKRLTPDGIEIWPWEEFLNALWEGLFAVSIS